MTWEFELLQPPYGDVSEGPVWDGTSLLYTQIQACRIMRYDPQTKNLTIHRDNTNYANGLVMDAEKRVLACEGGARRVVRYEHNGAVTVLVDSFEGDSLNLPNDLVIDPQGRVWFTDPFYEGSGGPFSYDRSNRKLDHDSVYRLTSEDDGHWTVDRMTFDTTRPNGLLFSLDSRTLYVAQSGRRSDEKRELRAYPVEDDGRLGAFTVLHDFGEHRGVDGMCLDTSGNIIATAGFELGGPGPSIYVFSPTGEVLQRHDVPAKRPTNCAFGDKDLTALYVTSTEGHLFRTQTDLQGLRLLG
ncbi:MAG: SMP-30/gluconolactonase/LRE family protein [Fuerstiella sp.]|nr:SMP-30/gluconolactonase/LRE family protein [Fuerstiella sp.]